MFRKLIATDNDTATTILRLVLGVIFFAHGAQKMLGWFGGYGFTGTMGFFTGMLHIPAVFAFLAIAAEFFGGLGLIFGLLTRVASFGVFCNMIVAVAMVHGQFGFWMNWAGAQKGEGYECYRVLSLLAERSIANTGLCLTDFAALEALLHKGPLTISEIQDKVRLASGSMTAAVDRLEKLGLVVRKSSPNDRRARIVELTAKGERLAASSFERHAKDLEALMSALSEKEMEQLHGSLKKLGLFAAEKLEEQQAKPKSR